MKVLSNPVLCPKMINRLAGGRDYYPLGLSLDNFLDLYFNVASFDVTLFSYNLNQPDFAFAMTGGVIGGLAGLGSTNDSVISNSSVSTRRWIQLGKIDQNGNDISVPNTAHDYPTFSAGGGGAFLFIDFGQSIFDGALYYPYIQIIFSNGPSNLTQGSIVGSVQFSTFGEIPIYGFLNGSNFMFASGSIEINQRYNNLTSDVLSTKGGQTIQLIPYNGSDVGFIQNVDEIYISGYKANFQKEAAALEVVIPSAAKSGQLIFIRNNPYNLFKSSFSLLIS